jgi:hypothetical protein
MSSLKSLAAAKNRRSGEQQQQTRPGTSIASHSAFAPQYQGRGGQQQQQKFQETQTIQPNGLPFTKLTVSDAIGLITLRLGKVEQFLMDTQNDGGFSGSKDSHIPENTKLIDNSVLTSIINRLDSLEKKEGQPGSNQNTEVINRIERELKDTKEMLINLMFKYELFTKETNNKFSDYESALIEIEKNIQPVDLIQDEGENYEVNDVTLSSDPEAEKILSAELKNMIKQELSEV